MNFSPEIHHNYSRIKSVNWPVKVNPRHASILFPMSYGAFFSEGEPKVEESGSN